MLADTATLSRTALNAVPKTTVSSYRCILHVSQVVRTSDTVITLSVHPAIEAQWLATALTLVVVPDTLLLL